MDESANDNIHGSYNDESTIHASVEFTFSC